MLCVILHIRRRSHAHPKPELREGEVVQGEYGATVYRVRGGLSSGGSNVRLWLTNQRIILKAALGPQRTLPLYAITSIGEEKVLWYDMIRLEFTGEHLEWLTVENQPQFLQTLRAIQAQAPVIPEGIAPAQVSPAISALFGGSLPLMALIAACVLIGACLFIVVFGRLWFIAQMVKHLGRIAPATQTKVLTVLAELFAE